MAKHKRKPLRGFTVNIGIVSVIGKRAKLLQMED